MALIAALVSAYAVSNARFAPGKMAIASCRNSTPFMRGMRWSARSKATLSLRSFSCFRRSSAPSGESLPITRYSAPYCERRSRSIARKTSESSSTLSKIGLAMLGPGPRQRDDYTFLTSLVELVRYRKLHSVAQFLSLASPGESRPLRKVLNDRYTPGIRVAILSPIAHRVRLKEAGPALQPSHSCSIPSINLE